MSRARSEGSMGYPWVELLAVACTAVCASKNVQAVWMLHALEAWGLPHQGLKACLHKMLVKGQGLVYPCCAHDYERNAVHESPCLILVRLVQCKALREQMRGEVHYVYFLCGQELGDDLNGLLLVAPGQGVADLQEYRVRHE